MKTLVMWMVGLALLALTGCEDEYLTKEEANKTYATTLQLQGVQSDLQEFAQDALESDQALAEQNVAQDKILADLQTQIDNVTGILESVNGTLAMVQGANQCLRDQAEALRCDLNQLKERMGDVDPRQLAVEVNELKGRANALAAEMSEVKGRLGTVEQVAGAASRKSDLATLQEEVRRLADRQRGTAESLEQARQNLQADVSRLGDQQRGTADNLEAERRERARIAEQLRLEKLNRFARQYPWEGDDFYQVVDRHQNAARSGPARIFIQKKDGTVVAEVFVWSSYQGRPYSTGAKELRSVTRQGDVLVYDGYDAGGWPCQHRIPAELFPSLNLALFDSPARRP